MAFTIHAGDVVAVAAVAVVLVAAAVAVAVPIPVANSRARDLPAPAAQKHSHFLELVSGPVAAVFRSVTDSEPVNVAAVDMDPASGADMSYIQPPSLALRFLRCDGWRATPRLPWLTDSGFFACHACFADEGDHGLRQAQRCGAYHEG